ncbi:MAG: virulence RhuM family protein [Actinomycetales bacterium]|nr:virulence RhuM family protein [Actinomycetales bacterium]
MSEGVELYRSPSGDVELSVRTDGESVWLTRAQVSELFGRDVKTIGKHIANARREELSGMAVVAKYATTAADGKTYQVEHVNLDVILSVGYRVKSNEGVHFRRWANDVLRGYLVRGVASDERRLAQLGSLVRIMSRSDEELVSGISEVVAAYLPGLTTLRDYDEGSFPSLPGTPATWVLTYEEARAAIDAVHASFPDDALFGSERGDALKGVIGAIYQGFGGHEIYPSVEEKAANLLYLVVKDHPLADGNKRSAAALFVHFLARNGILTTPGGDSRISNQALAAITLLVAMSEPREKELMISLVVNLLGDLRS